jgi:hypothetical protein
LAYVRASEGTQYALAPDTAGVRLGELREGQSVECLLSDEVTRLLSAKLFAD